MLLCVDFCVGYLSVLTIQWDLKKPARTDDLARSLTKKNIVSDIKCNFLEKNIDRF